MSKRDGLFFLSLALLGTTLMMPAQAAHQELAEDPPTTAGAGSTAEESTKSPELQAGGEPPLYIWLNSDLDLSRLMETLRNPDVVLLEWSKYQALLDQSRPGAGQGIDSDVTIESVQVEGRVESDQAKLSVTLTTHLEGPGPHRLPIRLDGQVLTSVRDGEQELQPKSGEGGAWFVQLNGEGERRIVATILTPIKASPDGSRLELMIPEAASTRLDLRTQADVVEAKLDGQELVEVGSVEGQEGSRIQAILTPRPKLDLSWRSASVDLREGPALLTAQGGIAIDITPGAAQVKASYEIRSEHGEARGLSFRLDPADQLLSVEVDGQPIEAAPDPEDPGAPIPLKLPSAIRPGTIRKLTITARRALPVGGPTRLSFRGFPLVDVAVQSGLIAVAQSGELWISGTAGRGLRQVDPRTELPPSLRVRPSNVLAYQFLDQPFELDLQVDLSPPWVRVDSRTTLIVGDRGARVETWLDYQVARGRVFEVRVELPEGLELDRVGPDRWVSAAEPLPRDPSAGDLGPRTLLIRLQPEAREGGNFQLHLVGQQRFELGGRVDVPLFRPLDGSLRGGRIAILAVRDLAVEPIEVAHLQRVESGPSPWPWPEDQPAGTQPPIWLEHDREAQAVALKGETLPKTVQHRTTLSAHLDRQRLDVRQETDCHVHYGTLSQIEIAVPPDLEGHWDVESAEVSRREPLGTDPSGDFRYRLILERPITDRLRLRFRFRVDLGDALKSAGTLPLTIPQIRLLEGESSPTLVEVAADAGLQIEPEGPGWSRVEGESAGSTTRGGPPIRLIRSGTGAEEDEPIQLKLSAHALVALPRLIVSRLWLQTSQESNGTVRGLARYRVEEHDSAMAVRLPEGAEWDRIRVGDVTITELEKLADDSGYRFQFPARIATGPVVVSLEYRIPASQASGAWALPELLGGGRVFQSFWEIGLPDHRALVGVPAGWNDENHWFWDWYVWKRRPRLNDEAISAWISGEGAKPRSSVSARGADHSYLFSRPGAPRVVRPPLIASRAWLVAVFSGGALAFGLVVLLGRIPSHWLGMALLLAALAAFSAWHPSVLFLGLQSSAFGLALVALAALTQRLVDRRRLRPSSLLEASGLSRPGSSIQMPVGPTTPGSPVVGSDDSTVIRRRTGTTVEHPSPLPAAKPKGSSIGPES